MQPATYYPFALSASATALVLSVITIVFVRRQLRTVLRNREADLLVKLYQSSSTSEMEQALSVVWSLDGKMPPDSQRTSCERACVFFELLGTLVECRYTGTEVITRFFGSLITGSYEHLRAYIDDQRKRPYDRNFALNFERLKNRIMNAAEVSPGIGQHPAATPSRILKDTDVR
ncbi:MAG: hypothetical protein QOK37_2967 [Thermoanaerobaculia bacterium]|nr:hypothetical protein [Thermoanaerobaculia bacterium]